MACLETYHAFSNILYNNLHQNKCKNKQKVRYELLMKQFYLVKGPVGEEGCPVGLVVHQMMIDDLLTQFDLLLHYM